MGKVKKLKSGTELPVSNIKGKDYLEVKWRLVWFREEHNDWSIKTQVSHHTDEYSIVEAMILDGSKVISMAHKREDKKHFQDHLEKAETGAIGRALAMCGYGTQFDGGELAEGERLADAPLESTMTKEDQIEYIIDLFTKLNPNGLSDDQKEWVKKLDNNSERQLDNLISQLQERLDGSK